MTGALELREAAMAEVALLKSKVQKLQDKVDETLDADEKAEAKVALAKTEVALAKTEVELAKTEVALAKAEYQAAVETGSELAEPARRTVDLAIRGHSSAQSQLESALEAQKNAFEPRRFVDVGDSLFPQLVMPLSELPAWSQLSEVLAMPLTVPIPVDEAYGKNGPWRLPDPDVLQPSRRDRVNDLAQTIGAVFGMRVDGSSEDVWHSALDALIAVPLQVLLRAGGVTCWWDRNRTDCSGSTTGSLRPDFLFWIGSGMLAFKGEEKAHVAQLRTAAAELSTKLMSWNPLVFGNLPYQLGYAAAGGFVRFYALDLKNSNMQHVSDIFNLQESPFVRSRCLRTVVNVARVLRMMDVHCSQPLCTPLGSVISRTKSSTVTIYASHVHKVSYANSGESLLDMYAALLSNPIPHLARSKGSPCFKAGALHVNLEPVGLVRRPCDSAERRRAAQCILTALEKLHALGWAHCDIRESNLMLVPPADWFLIDLEFAVPLDAVAPSIKQEYCPPEVIHDKKWGAAADMWQVGQLFASWGEPLIELGEKLCGSDPGARLTSSEALVQVRAI